MNAKDKPQSHEGPLQKRGESCANSSDDDGNSISKLAERTGPRPGFMRMIMLLVAQNLSETNVLPRPSTTALRGPDRSVVLHVASAAAM